MKCVCVCVCVCLCVCVCVMLHQALELGLESPDPEDSPAKAGLAMFLSFVFFGSLPIISYIFFAIFDNKGHRASQFAVSIAATIVALFVLGVLQVGLQRPSVVCVCWFCGTRTGGAVQWSSCGLFPIKSWW